MDTRSERFPLVDSLRALAALSVLFFHVAGYAGALGVEVLRDYTNQLQVGVALFFLISGFLLYRPFVAARVAGEALPAVGAYAWRRFLRIVPAYWVTLTVLALTLEPEIFDNALVFYGFGQVYDFDLGLEGLAVAWTLCVEVAFYALLPLYALAMRALPGRTREQRLRWELAGVVLLAALALAVRWWGLHGHAATLGATLLSLPVFLDWFALGMGLALASVWLQGAERQPLLVVFADRHPGVLWVLAAVAFSGAALAGAQLADGTPGENLALHLTYAATAFFLLVPAVFGDPKRGAVRRFMAIPALAWIGLVSYGIYLWQGPVLAMVGEWGPLGSPTWLDPSLWWLVIVPPLTVAAAALSYYVVERPALSLKRLVQPRGVAPDQPGAVSAPPLPDSR